MRLAINSRVITLRQKPLLLRTSWPRFWCKAWGVRRTAFDTGTTNCELLSPLMALWHLQVA